MASVYDLSLRQLKRKYIEAQKKAWKYQNKINKSHYTRTYDPYNVIKDHQKSLGWWQRRGVNFGHELRRREVWLIDPSRHNQTNI